MRLLLIAAAVASAACSSSPSGPDAVRPLIVVGTPPAIGVSTQFTALVLHSDGTREPVASHVTWKSSNTAVATVTDEGRVTGTGAGSVDVSATADGMRGTLRFDVASVTAFRLSGTVNDAATFLRVAGATVLVKDASGASISLVTDSSGNYAIGGVAAGPAEVVVRADGYIASATSTQLFNDTTLGFALGRPTACPTLGFDDLGGRLHGSPFTISTACGSNVTATTPNWIVATARGPSVQFTSPAGVMTAGELVVTAIGGARFTFQSVQVSSSTQFSSVLPVAYSFTGIANGTAAFVVQETRNVVSASTLTNPHRDTPIDALLIRLTNVSAADASQMGVDNIVVAR